VIKKIHHLHANTIISPSARGQARRAYALLMFYFKHFSDGLNILRADLHEIRRIGRINKQTQYKSEKVNNLKYSKPKLTWFSCLLQHSARKRGGLILQRSRAHTAENRRKIPNNSPLVRIRLWIRVRVRVKVGVEVEVEVAVEVAVEVGVQVKARVWIQSGSDPDMETIRSRIWTRTATRTHGAFSAVAERLVLAYR